MTSKEEIRKVLEENGWKEDIFNDYKKEIPMKCLRVDENGVTDSIWKRNEYIGFTSNRVCFDLYENNAEDLISGACPFDCVSIEGNTLKLNMSSIKMEIKLCK